MRPQPTAENRDIVVAMEEGEATLKEFHREQRQIRLQPKNPNMAPIIVKEGSAEVTSIGKVVGAFGSLLDEKEKSSHVISPAWRPEASRNVGVE